MLFLSLSLIRSDLCVSVFSHVAEVLDSVPDAVVDLARLLGAEVGAVRVVLARIESKTRQSHIKVSFFDTNEERDRAYPGLALLTMNAILGEIAMIAPLNCSNCKNSPSGHLNLVQMSLR